MAEQQHQDSDVDPKLLERLTLKDCEAPSGPLDKNSEQMYHYQPQEQHREPHSRPLNPYATAFLPLPRSSGTCLPPYTNRNNIVITDDESSCTHPQQCTATNPSVVDTNTEPTYFDPTSQSVTKPANWDGLPPKPFAPRNSYQDPLRYDPRNRFIPVNSTNQQPQYLHHGYGVRSISSAAPPNRQLAGRNGVSLNPSFEGFFTPNHQSLVVPDDRGKKSRPRRQSKASKPAASGTTEFRTLEEALHQQKGAQSPLNADRLRRSETPPKIVTKPPQPTSLYLERASPEPQRLATPQRLLLVLDLNGTLLFRNRSTQGIKPRSELQPFLAYCFKHHDVMIWSSARPPNVRSVCKRIFTPEQLDKLVAIWARDTLELSPSDYKDKVQVYKRLDRVWDDQDIQCKHPLYDTGGGWDQSNTLLIDDSALKASAQPWNHIKIPEYLAEKGREVQEMQMQVFGLVAGFLHCLRRYDDVSRCLQKKAFSMPEESGIALPQAVHELDERFEGWAKSKTHVMIFED